METAIELACRSTITNCRKSRLSWRYSADAAEKVARFRQHRKPRQPGL